MLSRAFRRIHTYIHIYEHKIYILKREEERRFRREWLVINHSVSARRHPFTAQKTIPYSKSLRDLPLVGSFARARLEKRDLQTCQKPPFTRAQSSRDSREARRVSHRREEKTRGEGGKVFQSEPRKATRAEKAQFIKICSSRR